MAEPKQCGCGVAPRLIFSCSGAADVGEVADRAARKLAREGAGKMACLAAIGARNPVVMDNTQHAGAILAIDGCPSACASKTLREAGFNGFDSLALASLGLQKGGSPAVADNVERVVEAARQLVSN